MKRMNSNPNSRIVVYLYFTFIIIHKYYDKTRTNFNLFSHDHYFWNISNRMEN